jgi:S-disulfanyl-L-cysteine oxidoreductase SoxD
MIAETPHIANYEDPEVPQVKMPNRDGFIPDPEFDPARLFRKK